jgi:hypothetical protein
VIQFILYLAEMYENHPEITQTKLLGLSPVLPCPGQKSGTTALLPMGLRVPYNIVVHAIQ